MSPYREVKFSFSTKMQQLKELKKQHEARMKQIAQSNQQDKWLSSWTEANANRTGSTNGSNQSKLNSFSEISAAIDTINSFLGDTGVSSVEETSTSISTGTRAVINNGSNNVVSTASVNDAFDQYSGYAQNINTNDLSTDVSYETLELVRQALGGWNSESLSNLKPRLAEQIVKVNQSLAQTQANYNELSTQKSTAEANVSRLEGQVDGAKNESDTAKASLDNNTSKLNSSIQARDQMDEQLSSVNSEYKDACSNVKTQEKNKSSAQTEVSSAKTSVAKSEAAVSNATQALESAQSQLDSTPKTLEDGTPNPEYETAKDAVKKAESDKQQAEQSLEQAKGFLESAETKFQEAETQLNDAQKAKDSVLQKLQQSESQYKNLAEKCEQMQEQVENSQDAYDTSLQIYDDANANYERLNSELETQQGILTQYEAVENQVKALQAAADSVNDLSKKLDEGIERAKQREAGSDAISPEKKAEIENDILERANSSEGCSASKTPLENMIACKDYDIRKCTGEAWGENRVNTFGTAEEFERQGYIKNSDGSFTDPRTGATMVNVTGDNWEWIQAGRTIGIGAVEYKNLVNRDWAGAVEAQERAKSQKNITLNGFDGNGKPKFKWE